jgi:hypothetical protein
MCARLERDVRGRASRERARIGERLRFAMRTPAEAGDAAPDDLVAAHDYTSYRWIRSCEPELVLRQRERLAHEALVANRARVRGRRRLSFHRLRATRALACAD